MDTRKIIQSQYCAALEMLKQAVEHCPDALWNAAGDKNKFWQIAYHALFYTHLYLQKTVAGFKPWAKHQDGTQQPGSAAENTSAAYAREEILAYLAICQEEVAEKVRLLDLEAPSGFEWLPFSKLELQIYTIRHIQQHAGELYERLGAREGIDVGWVDRCPDYLTQLN
jgi:hypothetical protein